MLIKTYGMYWNPNIIDWGKPGSGNKGQLLGEVKTPNRTTITINFWDEQGIYILHNDFKTIYVGKAHKTSIGKRLRDHLTDRLAGRWDTFSWFSASDYKITNNSVTTPGKRQISPETYIDTFEALAILIADPLLNRKRESLKGSTEAIQKEQPNPKNVMEYLEELLTYSKNNVELLNNIEKKFHNP